MAKIRASKNFPSAQPFFRGCGLRHKLMFGSRGQSDDRAIASPADVVGRPGKQAVLQLLGLLAAALLGLTPPPGRAEGGAHWRIYPVTAGRGGTFAVAVTVSPRGNVWVRQGGDGPASWLDGFQVRTIPFFGT